MQAFHFRLDQALRWRATQVSLQQGRLSVAVAQLAAIESALEAQKSALANAATHILQQPIGMSDAPKSTVPGDALQSFAAFKTKTLSSLRALEVQAAAAQTKVSEEMGRLIEANQKVRLLENLKRTDHTRWQHDFDHELAVFADEAFLNRCHSTLQSK